MAQVPTEPVLPSKPLLKAVPGDGQVLLYWDESAEAHFDEYLESLGLNPENFEGYKVYKSTDPNFLDALRITDNRGNVQRLAPSAQFDLQNEIRDFHPASINGVRFFLGSDVGLQRQWLDTEVINGRTYYYAVVAYTHGDALPGFPIPIEVDGQGNISEPLPNEVYTIPPVESEIDITIQSDGTVVTGRNTVRVIPRRPAAGAVEPVNPMVTRLSGSAGGTVSVEIIDPSELVPGANYLVTFRDTILPGTGDNPDLPTTRDFSLLNETTGDFVFDQMDDFRSLPLPIREGFRLIITSTGDTVRANLDLSRWESTQPDPIHRFEFSISSRFPQLADYRVEFFDEAVSESVPFEVSAGGLSVQLPAQQTNFRVFNETSGEEIPFAFSPNAPRTLNSVDFPSDQVGYIVGFAGLVQKTEDAGESWIPQQSGTIDNLLDVSFPTETVGFAVGNNGTIIRTTNGGEIWEDVGPSVSNNLRAVQFVDENTGFVTGQGGILLRTTNGGESWTQTVPADRDMNALFMMDANTGFIAGNSGRFYRTDDGGATWALNSLGLRVFNGIFFLDENNGYLVANAGRIFATTDGGQTFTETTVGSVNLQAVTFFDADNGLAVGNNGRTLRTSDGGTTWQVGDPISSFTLFEASLTASGDLFVVGEGLTRLKSADAGANFTLADRVFFFRAVLVPTQPGQPLGAVSDEIFFIEDFGPSQDVDTWKISMLPDLRGVSVNPVGGDALQLITIKPFTSVDSYTFRIDEENVLRTDQSLIADRLKDIKVVPNPYLVTHIGEPMSTNGRERQLHFTNLPAQCTIRIFSVSGRLIQTIQVDNSVDNDRFIWDMRTKDNDDLPYGVYLYHVTAPGVGETTGRFAVIK
ncbi:MAG: YCF48-related protein [Balneolaceae bacterium]